MDIPKELRNDIHLYCKTNNITDYDAFIVKCIRQGFTVEKYGSAPAFKEKIVEKIIEVPIEKVVEKIIEVPVTTVDTEMNEKYKQLLNELESIKIENLRLLNLNSQSIEKKKNKKDLYGE